MKILIYRRWAVVAASLATFIDATAPHGIGNGCNGKAPVPAEILRQAEETTLA